MKRRLLLFKTIAILTPFALLLVVELVLRLFNYGYDYSLFVEDSHDSNYLVMNQNASKKYFLNQAIATTGNSEPFKKIKEKNTTRIFVLGESTTIGYPYFHNGSFHRFLLYRLMHSMPEKNFEIINVSLTAVNSYTILDFAKQVVNYQPDAVLIYTGHNEYYGALGVGSTQQLGSNRGLIKTVLFLRRSRLMQFLTNCYTGLRSSFSKKDDTGPKDRMEMMAKNQDIAFGSAKYKEGITQFQQNMDETLGILYKHNTPVFFSTLVSNEKDLPPFISEKPGAAIQKSFGVSFTEGINALDAGKFVQASASLEQANKIFAGSADCNYYLGRAYLLQHQQPLAKTFFTKASDLDMLRFRAPAEINKVIRTLCSKYSNTTLVDAATFFEQHADDKLIGDELVLEHVHPNLNGYALLSQVYYEAMKNKGVLKIAPQNEMTYDELMLSMPVSKIDSLAGYYKIFNLKKMWPFVESKSSKKDTLTVTTKEEQLAYAVAFDHEPWEKAQSDLYDYYIANGDLPNAKKVTEGLVLEHPQEYALYEKAGNLCGQLQEYDQALFYFKKSFAIQPSLDKAKVIVAISLQQDKPADALSYIDYAISANTSTYDYARLKRATEAIIQLKNFEEKRPTDRTVLYNIANQYYGMGNIQCAKMYVGKILQLEPADTLALSLQTKLKQKG